jgi:hypothetical protein
MLLLLLWVTGRSTTSRWQPASGRTLWWSRPDRAVSIVKILRAPSSRVDVLNTMVMLRIRCRERPLLQLRGWIVLRRAANKAVPVWLFCAGRGRRAGHGNVTAAPDAWLLVTLRAALRLNISTACHSNCGRHNGWQMQQEQQVHLVVGSWAGWVRGGLWTVDAAEAVGEVTTASGEAGLSTVWRVRGCFPSAELKEGTRLGLLQAEIF